MDRGYTAAHDGNQRHPYNNRQGYGQQGYSQQGGYTNRGSNQHGRYDREDGNSENGGGGHSSYNNNDSHRGHHRENINGNRSSFSRSSNYNSSYSNNQSSSSNQPHHGSESYGQRRDSYGGNRDYSNEARQGSPETSPRTSNPTDSLRAYQKERSSDPYAVGLKSSAAFFHETYDKLERTVGLADRHSGTKHTVTITKTYNEIATQTTEDNIIIGDSTYNGVRIIIIDNSHQQTTKRNATTTMPSHKLQGPPPSVASSLLKEISSSSISSSSNTRVDRHSSEPNNNRRHQEYQAAPPSSSTWGDSLKVSAAQANQGMRSPSAEPKDSSNHQWNTKRSSEPNEVEAQAKPASTAVDKWGSSVTSSTGGGGLASAGWDDTANQKGVGAMVDWSLGRVAEFPTEAKPTKLVVTSSLNSSISSVPGSRQIPQMENSSERIDSNNQKPSSFETAQDRGRSQYKDISEQSSQQSSGYAGYGSQDNRSHNNSYGDSNRQSAPSQERKHMSSEERFNNSRQRSTDGYGSGYGNYGGGGNDNGAGVGGPTGGYESKSQRNNGYGYSQSSNRERGGGGGSDRGGGSQYGQSEGGPAARGYQNSQDHQTQSQNWNQSQNQRNGSSTTSSLSSPPMRRGPGVQNSAIASWSAAAQNPSGLQVSNGPNGGRIAQSSSTTTNDSKAAGLGKGYGGGSGLATATDFMNFMQAASTFTPPPGTGRKISSTAGGSRNGSVAGGSSVYGGSTSGSRPTSPTGRGRQQSVTKLEEQNPDMPSSEPQNQQQPQQQNPESATETHQENSSPSTNTTQAYHTKTDAVMPPWSGTNSDMETDWSKQVEQQEEEEEESRRASFVADNDSQPVDQPTEELLIQGLVDNSATPLKMNPESVPLPASRSSSHSDSSIDSNTDPNPAPNQPETTASENNDKDVE
ncbi:hypothetical protein BGZ49_005127 [Haplosporangium sp. Z 27]|nr:hypothetical protein BGZ49_005127 [Haplosporangium sp. Z 27]